jgi:hypothetical protein
MCQVKNDANNEKTNTGGFHSGAFSKKWVRA